MSQSSICFDSTNVIITAEECAGECEELDSPCKYPLPLHPLGKKWGRALRPQHRTSGTPKGARPRPPSAWMKRARTLSRPRLKEMILPTMRRRPCHLPRHHRPLQRQTSRRRHPEAVTSSWQSPSGASSWTLRLRSLPPEAMSKAVGRRSAWGASLGPRLMPRSSPDGGVGCGLQVYIWSRKADAVYELRRYGLQRYGPGGMPEGMRNYLSGRTQHSDSLPAGAHGSATGSPVPLPHLLCGGQGSIRGPVGGIRGRNMFPGP